MKKLLKPRADFVRMPIASDICDEKAFALLTSDGEEPPNQCRTFCFDFHCDTKTLSAIGNDIKCGEVTEWHDHDLYEINFVFSGKVYQIINGQKICLHRGDLLLMPPSVQHTLAATGGTNAVNLLLKSELVEQTAALFAEDTVLNKIIRSKSYIVFASGDSADWQSLISRFYDFSENVMGNRSLYAPCLDELAKTVLMTLAVDVAKHGVLSQGFSDREREPAKQILEYASAHFTTVSVGELSRRFSYSRMQIYRFFLKQTGYDFSDYMAVLRCERARSLLEHTDKSVTEIGEILGMERGYFSRFFKTKFGVTPRQYRKNLKEQKR